MKIPGILVNMIDSLFKHKINEVFEKYLKDYGKFIDHELILGSEPKVLMQIELNGETEQINVELSEIEILKESGEYYLIIGKITINREWMQKLGQDFLDGRYSHLSENRIKLPHQSGILLSKVF
ncbi:MAG: hypothetical protein K9M99_12645 [Candidatus Cloacimonetes bacterium]|nr:hypothetical protein [Candidatus Cloacimonadota bacterium]